MVIIVLRLTRQPCECKCLNTWPGIKTRAASATGPQDGAPIRNGIPLQSRDRPSTLPSVDFISRCYKVYTLILNALKAVAVRI